jgi:hypothetical protein
MPPSAALTLAEIDLKTLTAPQRKLFVVSF